MERRHVRELLGHLSAIDRILSLSSFIVFTHTKRLHIGISRSFFYSLNRLPIRHARSSPISTKGEIVLCYAASVETV